MSEMFVSYSWSGNSLSGDGYCMVRRGEPKNIQDVQDIAREISGKFEHPTTIVVLNWKLFAGACCADEVKS